MVETSELPLEFRCYHSYRDISISGLGGHIAISGCRSLLLSFEDTYLDVAVVGKLDFVTWIKTILILDVFVISQHDRKISPVYKKSHVFDVMRNNTSGAPIGELIVAFCTHFVFRKSHERTAPNAEQNFLLIQKLSCGLFLPPSAIRGLTYRATFDRSYARNINSRCIYYSYKYWQYNER